MNPPSVIRSPNPQLSDFPSLIQSEVLRLHSVGVLPTDIATTIARRHASSFATTFTRRDVIGVLRASGAIGGTTVVAPSDRAETEVDAPHALVPAASYMPDPDHLARRRRQLSYSAALGGTRAWVTAWFVLATIAVSVVAFVRHGIPLDAYHAMVAGAPTWDSVNDGGLHRLVLGSLLHADPLHLVGNCAALLILGPLLEARIGRWRMVTTIVSSGIAATVVAMEVHNGPSIGASGVAFGIIGTAVVLDPTRRTALGDVGLGMLVGGVFLTLVVDGISVGGHAGGLLAGLVIGALIRVMGVPRRGSVVAAAGCLAFVVALLAAGALGPGQTFDAEDYRVPEPSAADPCERLLVMDQGECYESALANAD